MAVTARGFYHLSEGLEPDTPCSGTACFASGAGRGTGESSSSRIYCLGRCYEAPVVAGRASLGVVDVQSIASEPIVLAGLLDSPRGRASIDSYRAGGGYQALSEAVEADPGEIIAQIKASRLRGRGGAGFPAGLKWQSVAGSDAEQKYVIANADEGDPGAYIDRLILERDPHLLIEAMAIAAVAVGATKGYIYLRAEYSDARAILEKAVAEARSLAILGESMFDSGLAFDVDVFVGEGSYLCGEETALIRSIEGRRPEPWARPPYPTRSGLFGKPTLVNNVETFASIPWIVRHGGEAFAEIGTSESTGTKAVSLNSRFAKPGLYEIDLGTPLSAIVDELGGGLVEGELLGVMCGGPLAGLVPPHLLGTPFSFEGMREINCSVGHGGIVAFGTETTIPALIAHVASFVAYESCGKCTPCRAGSSEIALAFAGAGRGPGGRSRAAITSDDLTSMVAALRSTSLCGHGTGFGEFLSSLRIHFPEQVAACLG